MIVPPVVFASFQSSSHPQALPHGSQPKPRLTAGHEEPVQGAPAAEPGPEPAPEPVLPVQLLQDLHCDYLRPDGVELPLLRPGSETILGLMPANYRYLFDMIIGWWVRPPTSVCSA